MTGSYNIALDGLKQGSLAYEWAVPVEFFRSFGNEEVLGADLTARVEARKVGGKILVDLDLDGTVTVTCDRCLEDLVLPLETGAELSLAFGGEDGEDEDGREIVAVEPGETEFDLSQTIYDYACLAIPLQRVHPEGECNPEMVARLGKGEAPEPALENNPFAGLKDMFGGNS